MRTVVAGLVVVGLAVAVFLAWPRGDEEVPPADATATTMTTITTTQGTTSTAPVTTVGSHVVTSVDEAEAILRELWFGWFEGIYDQDEDRIREVVASQSFFNAGLAAFGILDFDESPAPSGLIFDELEILKSTETCLAVWSVTRTQFLVADETRSGVEILRMHEGEWRFMSAWQLRDDLWEGDCDAQLLPLS